MEIKNIIKVMENLIIQIGWPQFIGIVVTVSGSLILIAWQGSKRFSHIETDIDWLKDGVKDLKNTADNKNLKAFGQASPIKLLPMGEELLKESGLKEFIDKEKDGLLKICEKGKIFNNAYDIQETVFDFFDTYKFPEKLENQIKNTAFEHGASPEILRRIGGIYFRKFCLHKHNYKEDDLDKPSS